MKEKQSKSAQFKGKYYANTAKMLPFFFFSNYTLVKYIVKAEPALLRFTMLHMHSKQYLHLLYTTLEALKTGQTPKKQIQVWTHSLGCVTRSMMGSTG